MKKRAIVNVATHRYRKGQERLRASIKRYSKVPFFGFQFEGEVGAPSHLDNPYAFKVFAIEHLRNQGYQQIFWFDASLWAIRDFTVLWQYLDGQGWFLEDSGHQCNTWSNDFALQHFGITRDQSAEMKMISSGFVGFDFTNPVAIELFARWKKAMYAGTFIGSWDNHRHDQTALSIAACQMGLMDKFSEAKQYFAYVGDVFGTPKESAVFHLQGI
jgi:hypothetical protein